MATKSKSASKSAPSKRSSSKPSKSSKSTAKQSKSTAKSNGAKSSKSKNGKTPINGTSRLRVPELAEIAAAARLLCCFNGPKSKRVETTQANPSTSRVQLVKSAIGNGKSRAQSTLGGKTADGETGKRLGFASLNAATEYAAGRTSNVDVPIETRRAMSALAQVVAVADGGSRTPSQTKVNGRVLVAILVALATAK